MAYRFNLIHRGASIVSEIDLFDECHYGADKLFLRGKFGTPQEVGKQVKIALGGDGLDEAKLKEIYEVDIDESFKKTKLGIGNPLEVDDSQSGVVTVPTIALNRFHIPNKKFWDATPPSNVINPYKASNAVTFHMRLYFRDDFAYITFGCPWSEVTLNENETAVIDIENGTQLIPHFKLLKCQFISKEDAIVVLNELFDKEQFDIEWDKNISRKQEQDVLELVDGDGSFISI